MAKRFRSASSIIATLAGFAWAAASCSPEPPAGTGGVDIQESFGIDGRSCGRGLAVVMSDYQSTNVALLDLDGNTLSGSFLSSGSTETKLNAPLSGDVLFPSSRMVDEIVLIDSYPVSVLTFVGVESADVRSQLSVRTGFDANPRDYLPIEEGRALVTRYGSNPRAGSEAFDGGDDLLWVDPEEPSVSSRIDLSELKEDEDERLRPHTMVRAQGLVLLTLAGNTKDFLDAETARVLALDADTGEIAFVHSIEGMKNCVGIAVSPDEKEVALSCSGIVKLHGNLAAPPSSGLVVLSVEEGGLKERLRVTAEELSVGPLGFFVQYASSHLVLFGASGAAEGEDAGRPDRLLALQTESGEVEEILDSGSEVFTLGGAVCMEACGVCFAADAGRGIVHRLVVEGDEVVEVTEHKVDSEVSLPPRLLGWF